MKIISSQRLRTYTLPGNVLPYAPRHPFAEYSNTELTKAQQLSVLYPEKRGLISHAFRALQKQGFSPNPPSSLTIEAHLDATKIPPDLAGRFIALGFEPDGFVRFNPSHYADHFTLKFKADATNHARRDLLRDVVERQAAEAFQLLNADTRVKEGYIELEIYPMTNRRFWNGTLQPGWREAFPLAPHALVNVQTPRTPPEALAAGLDLTTRKHADIHIKIARNNPEKDRRELIGHLTQAGFYPVFTWAGNDVCTAQFIKPADAEKTRAILETYFDRFGGCSEMTTEPVADMQRTRRNGQLATVPPLVRSLG